MPLIVSVVSLRNRAAIVHLVGSLLRRAASHSWFLSGGFLARLRQGFQEALPVYVVQENGLTPIPTAHDMINCTREPDW